MEIYRFAFIILLLSLLVSCGEKKQETGNADKAAEKKTPAFTASREGVLVKGSNYLENLSKTDCILW